MDGISFQSPVCSSHSRLSVSLYCRTQLPQQSCFLLHKTSVEYTRLYSSIAEVLLYIIEPRIPCNDVFSKCWIVESNPVGAWVLLKLYISSSPILAIHCSLWTNHSLSPHKTCNYHHHPCSTQQQFQTLMINSRIYVVFPCFSLFPHNFRKSCANFVSQRSKVQRFV